MGQISYHLPMKAAPHTRGDRTDPRPAVRGRTIKAQWQNDRPPSVSHRAHMKAHRSGAKAFHGKIQVKTRAHSMPLYRQTSTSCSSRTQPPSLQYWEE